MANDDRVDTDWMLLFGVWLLAAVGTAGSLFFSEVLEFAPCTLCWVQRIFMYPLVLILPVGLFPLDRGVLRYAGVLTVAGWSVALYHTLLYEGIIPESASPCSQGVSCKEEYIELLGFVSIPMMSLLAFTVMNGLLFTLWRRGTQ